MKEFVFTAEVTVTATTRIRARSEADALAQIIDRSVLLGGIGTGASDKTEWVIEDADGVPQNIHRVNH